MGYYNNPKGTRESITKNITALIRQDFASDTTRNIILYASDEDTHIRKIVYNVTGKLFRDMPELRTTILHILATLYKNENNFVRQTVIYALGEIGKIDTQCVLPFLEKALVDRHHAVRNAVTGSLKKIGEKNPGPVLSFVKKFIDHSDSTICRLVIHGIELRGRTHPEDVLPLLYQAQKRSDPNIYKIIIHVLGQISYKKGCLEKVIDALKKWENSDMVNDSIKEILDVHKRYGKFSVHSYQEALHYIENQISLKTINKK